MRSALGLALEADTQKDLAFVMFAGPGGKQWKQSFRYWAWWSALS